MLKFNSALFRGILVGRGICMAGFCSGQLSGSYTIDATKAASASNYLTFTSAVSDLDSGTRLDGGKANGKGVKGGVVFNVADGIYYEELNIDTIFGTSKSNTVTFQSASGDSTKVILYDTSFLNYSLVGLAGTIETYAPNFVVFQDMTIERRSTGATITGNSVFVVDIFGPPGNTVFRNDVILFNSFCADGIVVSIRSDGGNMLLKNSIIYGNEGIDVSYWNGINSNLTTTIENNYIDSFGIGIWIRNYGYTVQIKNNFIFYSVSQSTYPSAYPPIPISETSGTPITIKNNYLNDYYNGIYLMGGSIDTIVNNVFFGTNTAIDINDVDSCYYYILDNTIWAGTFIQSNNWGNHAQILNNDIANPGYGGIIYYIDSINQGTIMDYNNYFFLSNAPLVYPGGIWVPNLFGQWNSGSDNTLQQWQKDMGVDKHSLGVNPDFAYDSVLSATNDTLAGAGIDIQYITKDIYNIKRPNPPTIGANEIKPGNIKAITALFDTLVSNCEVSFFDNSERVGCGFVNHYHWSFGDGSTDTFQFPTHTYAYNGAYTVKLKITSSGGCSDSISEKLTVTGCATMTSIKNLTREQSPITLYPNPAINTLNIGAGTNIIQSIEIYDAMGRAVGVQNFELLRKVSETSVQVNTLPSGIYIIKLGTDNGSYVAKFMKE